MHADHFALELHIKPNQLKGRGSIISPTIVILCSSVVGVFDWAMYCEVRVCEIQVLLQHCSQGGRGLLLEIGVKVPFCQAKWFTPL